MIDPFNIAIQKAYTFLSTIETVYILHETERKKAGFADAAEVWKVGTELLCGSKGLICVTLFIVIGEDFPLSFPRIYLSEKDYDEIKYIPHVDCDRFICTFDSETSRPNPEAGEQIIPTCLNRAKKILSEGIDKINFSDFEEEFLSYWGNRFTTKDSHTDNVLCLFNEEDKIQEPKIIEIRGNIGYYRRVFHINDARAERFREFLKTNKIQFEEHDCFYAGDLLPDFTPPFDYTNGQTLDLIAAGGNGLPEKFEHFIDSAARNRIVLARVPVDGKHVYIGWEYKNLVIERNGYRPGSLKASYVIRTFQKNDKIMRISPGVFTRERLSRRTTGETIVKNLNFLIAGTGSVGSYLLQFLNTIDGPELRLVDKDSLKAENAGRHLLGLCYTGQYKTIAIKDFLLQNNPLQKITTREDVIQSVFNNEPAYVNEVDYIFMTTGNTNVEQWLGEKIANGEITKPVFFIWLEPYLCAGHCLFIHPRSYSFNDFHTNRGYFKFNVIDEGFYESDDDKIALREGGCQTTYMPYSGSNVLSFLGSLFPRVSCIIENGITESKCFSWFGNIEEAEKKGVLFKDIVKGKMKGELVENRL